MSVGRLYNQHPSYTLRTLQVRVIWFVPINPRTFESAANMKYQKFQTNVRTLLVLVACCGAMAWALHHVVESNHVPTTVDWARKIDSGALDDRKLALQRLREAKPAEVDVVVSGLMRALADTDASVRGDAALALAQCVTASVSADKTVAKEHTHRVADSLLKALREDDDSGVRATAASALSTLRRAMVKAGSPPDEPLSSGPLGPETLVAAFEAEMKRDPKNRGQMIAAFERLGPMPLPAPPAMLDALDDPSSLIRGNALLCLGNFSGGVDRAIPTLLKELETNEERFPADYVGAARKLRPSPATAPLLIQSLESEDGLVREAAAILLGRIEPVPRAAASAFVAAVKKAISIGEQSDQDSSDSAGARAGGISANSGNRRPQPPPGSVSTDLAIDLARTAPPEQAVPLLLDVLQRKSRSSRNAGAAGLAQIGPAAHAAIPALVATLKEANTAEGFSAAGYAGSTAKALGAIAPGAPEAQAMTADVIAVLEEALEVKIVSSRAAAAHALGNFGPKAAGAAPKLRELLKDEAAFVIDAATSALEKIEPQAKPAHGATP